MDIQYLMKVMVRMFIFALFVRAVAQKTKFYEQTYFSVSTFLN